MGMEGGGARAKGQVYSGPEVVALVLDAAGYSGPRVLGKDAMENSCGRGAFLEEMARRYAEAYVSSRGSPEGLSEELRARLHGIDIDPANVRASREALDRVAACYGQPPADWDVAAADTLDEAMSPRRRGNMDFVVGNPPYVAPRNMGEAMRRKASGYAFSADGTADLYIVFFEIGLRMLRPGGTLAYITPSTYMFVRAGRPMRRLLRERLELKSLIDVSRYDAFADAQTSSIVTCMEKGVRHESVEIREWASGRLSPACAVDARGLFVGDDDEMYLVTDPARREALSEILSCSGASVRGGTGARTGLDRAFFDEEREGVGSGPYIRRAYKARRGAWYDCICPYEEDGTLAPLSRLPPEAVARLRRFEAELRGRPAVRDRGMEWYAWASPSEVRDMALRRVAVSNLVTDLSSVRTGRVPPGCIVYGSPWIAADPGHPPEALEAAMHDRRFVEYVEDLHKIKGEGPTEGGRGTKYEFTLADLKRYMERALVKGYNP